MVKCFFDFRWFAALTLTLVLTACTSKSVSVEPQGGDPWFRAARTADIAVLSGMVLAGKPIDEPSNIGVTALMVAARAGNVETVKWLLKNGASAAKVDRDDQSALVYALVGEAQDLKLEVIVDELLRAGADPFLVDKTGLQPIQTMIELELNKQIKTISFTDKKPCDRGRPRAGQFSLSAGAKKLKNTELEKFFIEQGCW